MVNWTVSSVLLHNASSGQPKDQQGEVHNERSD